MLVDSSIDDIILTSAFTGLATNMILPSMVAAGFDPTKLNEEISAGGGRNLWRKNLRCRPERLALYSERRA